jgi:hypothetical protein
VIQTNTPGNDLKKDGKSSFFMYVNNTIPHAEHIMS